MPKHFFKTKYLRKNYYKITKFWNQWHPECKPQEITSKGYFWLEIHTVKKRNIYIYIFAGKDQSQRFTDNLEAATCRCSLKKMFLKFCNIHEETVALQSLFNKVTTLNTCTAISGRLTFLIVGKKCWYFAKFSLREKCSNTEFFLVRIFPYLD